MEEDMGKGREKEERKYERERGKKKKHPMPDTNTAPSVVRRAACSDVPMTSRSPGVDGASGALVLCNDGET